MGEANVDKVIVITGGGRGIGAATALLAAELGYRICINYQSDESAAQEVLEQVRAKGAQAIAVRADVSIEDEVIGLFDRVDAELGRVTALVNNAGTVAQKSRLDEMSEFRILKIMKTNVLGPILCAKHAVLRMSPRHGGQGGSIVNVSSVAARLGAPGSTSITRPPRARWTPSPSACPRKWPAKAFASTRCVPATSTPISMP